MKWRTFPPSVLCCIFHNIHLRTSLVLPTSPAPYLGLIFIARHRQRPLLPLTAHCCDSTENWGELNSAWGKKFWHTTVTPPGSCNFVVDSGRHWKRLILAIINGCQNTYSVSILAQYTMTLKPPGDVNIVGYWCKWLWNIVLVWLWHIQRRNVLIITVYCSVYQGSVTYCGLKYDIIVRCLT